MGNENGRHIKVHLNGVGFDALKNTGLIGKLLIDLVHAAGMRELGEPIVYDIRKELERQGEKTDNREPEGVTGIVVLSTSHCAIHTWPHRGYAVVDVYSCQWFEMKAVTAQLVMSLDPWRFDVRDLSDSLVMPPPPD